MKPGMVLRGVSMCALVTACTAETPQGLVEPDEVICGVANVEDMVALPDSPWIIGSGIGDSFFQSGGLHLINEDEASAAKLTLDLSEGLKPRAPFDQCSGPPPADAFSAHGLSLVANADGTSNLYVVNHGGRESIEVFEVRRTEAEPQFSWIGCVATPDTATSNSVSARPDGSIVMSASGTYDEPAPSFAALAEMVKSGVELPEMDAEAASSTRGAVFTWTRDQGWMKVPNSELKGNNGIELSRDGKWAWVNSWPGSSVTFMPLDPVLGESREVKLDFKPDNIRWSAGGSLVATGHLASIDRVAKCAMGDPTACEIDYMVAAIDPDSFEVKPLFRGKGTQQLGAATIALKTVKNLWIGTVRGQCIGRVALQGGE
ncbi:MAG: hypothetical protein P8J20_19685 [Novosphingobium sp.]|nr:hypothetical protein [Novosphingobium sp.]